MSVDERASIAAALRSHDLPLLAARVDALDALTDADRAVLGAVDALVKRLDAKHHVRTPHSCHWYDDPALNAVVTAGLARRETQPPADDEPTRCGNCGGELNLRCDACGTKHGRRP